MEENIGIHVGRWLRYFDAVPMIPHTQPHKHLIVDHFRCLYEFITVCQWYSHYQQLCHILFRSPRFKYNNKILCNQIYSRNLIHSFVWFYTSHTYAALAHRTTSCVGRQHNHWCVKRNSYVKWYSLAFHYNSTITVSVSTAQKIVEIIIVIVHNL